MKASARDRLEAALARIADPQGEGSRTFLKLYAESARDAAASSDARRMRGLELGPLDGAIISIKDMFDWPNDPTPAGSRLLAEAPPARVMAPAIAKLVAAGAVIIGRTNMTEFAFSGVGINPHYGTPGNPADRARVPGGSSSGAAVSVADGMAEIAIGSDTGGSTRTPASLCGITGFKPSQQRISRAGAFPLSHTLDSIGPLARDVAACALTDAAMAGDEIRLPRPLGLSGLRLGIPQGALLQGLEPAVARAFDAALKRLERAGANLFDLPFADILEGIAAANATGGFAAMEAFAIHRGYLDRKDEYDAIVLTRIERGRGPSAADYIDLLAARRGLVAAFAARAAGVDAMILPTTPIQAPEIAALADEAAFFAANALLLRNTSMFNFLDACAISLPMPETGELPAGLMLAATNGRDKHLFSLALSVEAAFKD